MISFSFTGKAPADAPELPEIFTAKVIYFHDVEEDEKKRLSRYVIAYPFLYFILTIFCCIPVQI